MKINGRFDCGHFISDGFGDERRCLFYDFFFLFYFEMRFLESDR
ncbi:hypothetical protein LEP1GSC162_3066 [Leptospira santarosai str. CBC1531]|nr:hypothetical protein LEP1GSC071_2683 [Leptospira santarosai str. JET]EMP82907.1 hypothetical protein LEP1GSC162_3066 [Leptospira santarosai str. CBC1531]EPG83437.1 hypothetical protein LEP1GSC048_2586 [Leptospira santarosai serovar Shermani str. 1342KT]